MKEKKGVYFLSASYLLIFFSSSLDKPKVKERKRKLQEETAVV